MEQQDLLQKSSDLCLACGLCCQGVLHDHALLQDNEQPLAATLQLTIELKHDPAGDYYAFRLPCPCYQDNGCSVYDRRPSTCSQYQCVVLKNFKQGTTSFTEALELIQSVKALFNKVQSQLGSTNPSLSIWEQVAGYYEQTGHHVSPTLPLEVKELWEYGYYSFDRKILGLPYPYHENKRKASPASE